MAAITICSDFGAQENKVKDVLQEYLEVMVEKSSKKE